MPRRAGFTHSAGMASNAGLAMRPLRIGYVVSSLVLAGGERQMVALAERLPTDRFAVEFLARIGAGPLDERARAAGAEVIHLGSETPEDAGPVLRAGRLAERTINHVRVARRRRYDILDAWLYPSDLMVALTRPLTRPAAVVAGRINVAPRASSPGMRALDRIAGRWTDAVVAICQTVADVAVEAHGVDPTKLRIIRNGVELTELPSEARRDALRAALGAAPEEVLIGCVANYRDMKGHDVLLDAFADLLRTRPDLRLVLVGEGPTRTDIERRIDALGIGARVRVHGLEREALRLYAAFDLVVQASRSEGLPNVLLEAAAAARPIVATAAGGSGEVVLDGLTGLLVPVDDRSALVSAMQRMVDDPPLRARLGAAARDHVAAMYGMDRYVREWGAFYEELAAAKGVAV